MLALKYPTYPWQQLYLLNTRYKQQASMEEALEILFPVLRTLSPGPTEDSLTISLWFVGCTQNTQRKKRGGTSQPHNRVIYGTRCLHTFVTSWIWIPGILSHTLRTATWKMIFIKFLYIGKISFLGIQFRSQSYWGAPKKRRTQKTARKKTRYRCHCCSLLVGRLHR